MKSLTMVKEKYAVPTRQLILLQLNHLSFSRLCSLINSEYLLQHHGTLKSTNGG